MDDIFLPALITSVFLVLSTIGVFHISKDFRHYDQILRQCQKQGFIQNETTRITCKVES